MHTRCYSRTAVARQQTAGSTYGTKRCTRPQEAGAQYAGLLCTQAGSARQLRIHTAGSRPSSRLRIAWSSIVHPFLSGCTSRDSALHT